MDVDRRSDLIDTYYGAVDDEDYARMVEAFTEDAEYRYPGEDPMRGRAAIREFFEERRATSATTHDVFRRIHDDADTACEGTITGRLDGDAFDGRYVGIFEFDDDAEKISYAGVYTQF